MKLGFVYYIITCIYMCILYKLITQSVQHTNVTVHFSLINCEFKNNQFLDIDSNRFKFNHHAFNN